MTEKEKRSIFVDLMQNKKYVVDKNFTNEKYITIEAQSNVCLDYQKIFLLLEDNKIKDIKFFAESCLISKASTNLWIEKLVGKSFIDALKLINNFDNFITGKEFKNNDKMLFELFESIRENQSRTLCALFGVSRISKVIKEVING